jgi:hypothetical protein
MKRIYKTLMIIAFVILALLFMSNTAYAPDNSQFDPWSETVYYDGMTYRIFMVKSGGPGGGIAIDVVNVTKEKLEIEKLKAEIAYYKKIH